MYAHILTYKGSKDMASKTMLMKTKLGDIHTPSPEASVKEGVGRVGAHAFKESRSVNATIEVIVSCLLLLRGSAESKPIKILYLCTLYGAESNSAYYHDY